MSRTSNSDGYVTLAVLLVVGLLATIVSSLLAVSRPALGLARIGGEEVAADALLEAGLTTAGFLLYGAKRAPDSVDGLVLRLRTGDVRIRVADESGRVDLNAADPPLLAGLFRAVGGTSMSADNFASRVIDWRDKDSDLQEGGAEAASYSDAGLTYGPSNRLFHSVEESRFVLGLSRRDFANLEPYLTVFSGSSRIDPQSASETVLRAIPGIGRRDVQQLLQAQRAGESRARIVARVAGVPQYFLSENSGVYRVGVQVRLSGGYGSAIEAVISAPQQKDSADYRVVAWSRMAPELRPQ